MYGEQYGEYVYRCWDAKVYDSRFYLLPQLDADGVCFFQQYCMTQQVILKFKQ